MSGWNGCVFWAANGLEVYQTSANVFQLRRVFTLWNKSNVAGRIARPPKNKIQTANAAKDNGAAYQVAAEQLKEKLKLATLLYFLLLAFFFLASAYSSWTQLAKNHEQFSSDDLLRCAFITGIGFLDRFASPLGVACSAAYAYFIWKFRKKLELLGVQNKKWNTQAGWISPFLGRQLGTQNQAVVKDELDESPEYPHWPGDWPGRRFVNLDCVGDPGDWLSLELPSEEEVLTQHPDEDEATAEALAGAYIQKGRELGFPLATDAGVSEERMREIAVKDFVGFIREWRRRAEAAGCFKPANPTDSRAM